MAAYITLHDVGISMLRWIVGLCLGSVAGIFFGLISYYYRYVGEIVKVVFDFGRAIPIIGLVPVIQWWIGIDETGKIGLIAWGVMFPVWISVRNVEERRLSELEVILKTLSVSPIDRFRVYTMPRLLAGILRGVEIGIGVAWLCVVAAEFIGTYSKGFWAGGLGYKLQLAFDVNNWRQGVTALVIFGLLGVTSAKLWSVAKRALLRRQNGFDPLQWSYGQ